KKIRPLLVCNDFGCQTSEKQFGLSYDEMKQIVLNGVVASFLPESGKISLRDQIDEKFPSWI
ncbi:MAG: hypothetical protein ACI4E1_00060, partial [Lachnospira sp.]